MNVHYQAVLVLAGDWPVTPHPTLLPGGKGSTAPKYELPSNVCTFYYLELAVDSRLQRKVDQLRQVLEGSKGNITYDWREDLYDREDLGDGRIMPQSWHEGRRYDRFEEPYSPVETRSVRGRRKPQTGSLLALTSENDINEKSRPDSRRRRVASVRHKEPTSSSLPRSGAIYGTLPRKPRKPRSPAPDLQPLVRRSTVSKENVSLEESDEEAQTKHRALSASPVRKIVKKKPPNSLDIMYSKNQALDTKPRTFRTRRKNVSKSLPNPPKEEEKEATDNLSEDTFSMTYSEEDKREAK